MKTDRQSSAPIWVSLATSPFLIGVLTARSLTQALIELGKASEEVFRGDRLPILNFPDPQDPEQESN